MNYQEFLQRNRYQDSPVSRYEFEKQFGGANNLGMTGPQVELADRGVHGTLMSNPNEVLYDTTGQEGRNFLVATDRYHNEFPLGTESPTGLNRISGDDYSYSGTLENYQAPQIVRDRSGQFINQYNDDLPFRENPLTGELPITETDTGPYTYQPEVYDAPIDSGLLGSTSALPSIALETGASGYPSVDAAAGQMYGGTGISEELASQTAAKAGAESAWGGPATFAGNMALNMIPTRDRNKVNTPLGDEGSMSGILKGTGKGALLGGTISGGNPYAIAGGAALGALGGTSGYFDSTSPPVVQISRVKRRGGGMPQGLLGGGSFYG